MSNKECNKRCDIPGELRWCNQLVGHKGPCANKLPVPAPRCGECGGRGGEYFTHADGKEDAMHCESCGGTGREPQ